MPGRSRSSSTSSQRITERALQSETLRLAALVRGHRIVTVDDYNQFGSGQMIWKMDGGWLAASDPRRDGQATGF